MHAYIVNVLVQKAPIASSLNRMHTYMYNALVQKAPSLHHSASTYSIRILDACLPACMAFDLIGDVNKVLAMVSTAVH